MDPEQQLQALLRYKGKTALLRNPHSLTQWEPMDQLKMTRTAATDKAASHIF